MNYFLLTIGVFLLYIGYDINSITINSRLLNKLFIVATLIFGGENLVLLYRLIPTLEITVPAILLLMCAIIFFVLLIYTLFFALPFSDTYLYEHQKPKVVRTGMYGLSRHIGVMWFILMYGCLALAFDDATFTGFALVACVMNVVYIIFQDNYSFVRIFDDYEDYKQEVPFLFPSLAKIKKFLF